MDGDWTLTATGVAQAAGASYALVRQYALAGRLPFRRLSNGNMVFGVAAPAMVREMKAANLARRGGRRERRA